MNKSRLEERLTAQSLETALTLFEGGYEPAHIVERLGLSYGRQWPQVLREARKARKARLPVCKASDFAQEFAAF